MGWLRVISGQWRGRRLSAGPDRGTNTIRPTADRVRTSLFDRLSPVLPGARVLDLCAGTGALGIEALSRGAQHVTFVDRSGEAIKLLTRNLESLGLTPGESVVIRRDDALRAIHALSRLGERFDLILVDPPYDASTAAELLGGIEGLALLEGGGQVVVEHDRRRPIPGPGRLVREDERLFGDTTLSFYSLEEGED
jgi:16S rRNA (guanine966-N2)-methyltransferase